MGPEWEPTSNFHLNCHYRSEHITTLCASNYINTQKQYNLLDVNRKVSWYSMILSIELFCDTFPSVGQGLDTKDKPFASPLNLSHTLSPHFYPSFYSSRDFFQCITRFLVDRTLSLWLHQTLDGCSCPHTSGTLHKQRQASPWINPSKGERMSTTFPHISISHIISSLINASRKCRFLCCNATISWHETVKWMCLGNRWGKGGKRGRVDRCEDEQEK